MKFRRENLQQLLVLSFLISISKVVSLSSPSLKSSQGNNKQRFDVIVVGGSTAGLSAALSLGRSFRSVLVIDSGTPCNQFQSRSHNLLGYDGVDPSRIREQFLMNVSAYPTVQWLPGTVAQVQMDDDASIDIGVTDEGQGTIWVQGQKLVIATGVEDMLPNHINGVLECWGKTVIHCPYCHGYEFANARTALLHMTPSTLMTMAPILKKFTNELFVVGRSSERGELASLEKNGIELINKNVVSIRQTNGVLDTLILDDDTELAMDVAYLRPPFQHRFPLKEIPSLHLDDKGYIPVDTETQKTSIPNVYACGDCTDPNRSLSIAMASGTRAAKMLNYELSMEDWKP
jgi:thioredoxin reductase